jgi:hypothetical protein
MTKNTLTPFAQYMTAVYVTLGIAASSYYINHWFLPALPVATQRQSLIDLNTAIPKEQGIYVHFIQ